MVCKGGLIKEGEVSTRKHSTSGLQEVVLWTKSVFTKIIPMIEHTLKKYNINIRTENVGTSCPCSVDWASRHCPLDLSLPCPTFVAVGAKASSAGNYIKIKTRQQLALASRTVWPKLQANCTCIDSFQIQVLSKHRCILFTDTFWTNLTKNLRTKTDATNETQLKQENINRQKSEVMNIIRINTGAN